VVFLTVVFLAGEHQAEGVAEGVKIPVRYARFFRDLGRAIRAHRSDRKLSQEDMISHGFDVRHWQRIEAGKPFNLITLLRICDAFDIRLDQMVGPVMHSLGPVKPDAKGGRGSRAARED
jgi:hypothetical protein